MITISTLIERAIFFLLGWTIGDYLWGRDDIALRFYDHAAILTMFIFTIWLLDAW